ncbi:hypothetical protein [Gloeocapsa sp. PCC 73106]|uniref:O-linked N-acetylglucosamine transferase family protein n=1 Tax=Gloeocapsa sp. PCC 73106 TaxID=102232 RepID=UPI0002AC6CEB|nr:hypothetical protein [Gloeocapsa sp. PCC 73106]ELR98063.1 hypothetical protein GLO73106DRAFT_00018850 [Gloeocapsa sp. PCC 73106]
MNRLNQEDYWRLNLVCDIFLDSIGWTGGNTTLEAIACDLPVVTTPGEFMRGRHSSAILTMLQVTDTIGADVSEYIDIAVKLGLDQSWRDRVLAQMKANHHLLYDDLTCISGLEAFFTSLFSES